MLAGQYTQQEDAHFPVGQHHIANCLKLSAITKTV
ncbi:hypothetical protein predicted by Glimmer/Critica [Acetobacter ghanensis]|uniref:Uncharacterized protein n=1 Tax=Acetobacter ghanensis TaxID=431306 RepID=A0A0U5F4G7_9PROT|nr:hypothetical protein predicted by Glimmer/Critica [Acetobacter ghanensis]